MTQNQAQVDERDVRLQVLNTFLQTPHRKIEALAPLHAEAVERDPLFYSRLAVWYLEKGEVRDHKILFISHLAVSEYPEFREAAGELLLQLDPYELPLVLDFIKRGLKRNRVSRYIEQAVKRYLRVREANVKQFDGAALRAPDALKGLYAGLHVRPGERAQAILFDGQPPQESRRAAVKRLAAATNAEEHASIILDARIS